MPAKDFITNVTAVFPNAQARVVPDESDNNRSKYTMKGISPRAEPTDLRGRPYVHCLWRTPLTPSTESSPPIHDGPLFSECDLWFSSTHAEDLWTHVVDVHLEVPRDPDNQKRFRDGPLRDSGRKFACMWSGCNRYPLPGVEDAYKVCMHVKSHLPDHGPGAAHRAKYTRDPNRPLSPPRLDSYYLNTPTDEQGHPIGLPLAGILVLRNLARQMLKIDENDPRRKSSLIEQHFSLHQEKIFRVMTYNYSLRQYTPEFIHYVSRGLEEAHKHTPLVVPGDMS
jgi:chromatin structure-remodeling complex subunit RSC9